MNAAQFVANWRREKEELMEYFMGASGDTVLAAPVAALGLTPEQLSGLREVLDAVLHDTMFTLLLGLEGATSIGGDRRHYRILDDQGNPVAAPGQLEAEAWKQFPLE
jgi:hypothetical protein